MTDKEYKREKQRIQKLIEKWVRPIGLGWWRIKFEYEREEPDSREKTAYAPKVVGDYWRSVMVTTCDPNYLRASVVSYLTQTRNIDDEELEETFVHELMHIFLAPMSHEDHAAEEERVATLLARGFIYMTSKEGGDEDAKISS